MLTFAVSQGSGFVGGPIFPALFIGGTAGVLVHQVFPGVPLGLAFTCLLAAVPGSVVPAPFSMVLMAAFLTQVGALQTAPILIAVVTAFLAMEGRQVPHGQPQAGARRRSETSRSGLRARAASPAGGWPSQGQVTVKAAWTGAALPALTMTLAVVGAPVGVGCARRRWRTGC